MQCFCANLRLGPVYGRRPVGLCNRPVYYYYYSTESVWLSLDDVFTFVRVMYLCITLLYSVGQSTRSTRTFIHYCKFALSRSLLLPRLLSSLATFLRAPFSHLCLIQKLLAKIAPVFFEIYLNMCLPDRCHFLTKFNFCLVLFSRLFFNMFVR